MEDSDKEYLENLQKGDELYKSGQYLKAVSFWFQALKLKFSIELHKKILDVLNKLPEQHKPSYLFAYGRQLLISIGEKAKVEALEVLSMAVALDHSLSPRVQEIVEQAKSAQLSKIESALEKELDEVLTSLEGAIMAEAGEGERKTEQVQDLMNEIADIFKE